MVNFHYMYYISKIEFDKGKVSERETLLLD